MTLMTLLVVLALDRLLVGHREIGIGQYIDDGLSALTQRLPESWNGIAAGLALVAPAVVVTALLQWLLSGWLFGLVGFVFAIAVALLMLGPADVLDDLDHYLDASRRGDGERRAFYYQRLVGEDAGAGSTAEAGDDVARAVLYRLHDHLFAPLFWFCLLGPMGAVFYRVAAQGAMQPPAALAERPALVRALADITAVLGWLPARLLAFGYAMTGRFDSATRRLRAGGQAGVDWLAANRSLLGETGLAALDGGEADGDEPVAAQRAAAARSLAIRAGIFWLALLALLTLTGWVG